MSSTVRRSVPTTTGTENKRRGQSPRLVGNRRCTRLRSYRRGALTPRGTNCDSVGVAADEFDPGAGVVDVNPLLNQETVTVLFGLPTGLLGVDAC